MKPTIAAITVDCNDAAALASFWAAVLDQEVAADATAEFAQLAGAAPALTFTKVPEPKQVKNRVHLDLEVADLPSAVTRVVGLGAAHVGDFDQDGYRWATLADPEGNEFDLVAAA